MRTDAQTAPQVVDDNRWIGWLPLIALPVATIIVRDHLPAWLFMWLLALAIFLGLKWETWCDARSRVEHSAARSLAYLIAWPGMDAEAFLDSRRRVDAPPYRAWLLAFAKTLLGSFLLWFVARKVSGHPMLEGWIGLLGLVFLLHFGTFHLIALFWQANGVDAQPIMSNPATSKTLSEFWGRRWNLGFRQLAHQLIFRPLHKHTGVAVAGLLVFVVSGLIHDLVISLPARAGYGLPTAYFVAQGLGVTLERSRIGRDLGLQSGLRGWIFMVILTAGPAYWLFHPPFVERVMLPFMHTIHAL